MEMNDHDLLIEVKTMQSVMLKDLKELKDNFAIRVSDLEEEKVNKADWDEDRKDKESRVRFIEKYVWGAMGILGLLNFIGFGYIISQLK